MESWLKSRKNPPQPVSTDKLILRLRLDEGGGEVLKNSAPHAQPASFDIGKTKLNGARPPGCGPISASMQALIYMLGQTGDRKGTSRSLWEVGSCCARRRDYTVEATSGALLSKMDTTQHNRGWDLSIQKGILSVDLVNQEPKKQAACTKTPVKKGMQIKEAFHYPTPTDLTAKDLAPNKPKPKKEDPKKATPRKPKPRKRRKKLHR